MIDNNLKRIIKEYQELPNAPFFQKYTSEYIKDILDRANIPYVENEYLILVKPPKTTKKKLLLMAHTDHPGIVFSGENTGQILGLIGTKKIIGYLDNNDIKIKVFSIKGAYLGKAIITNIIPGPKQEIKVATDFDIPKNSIGMFDVSTFYETEETLELYNADNGLMVSILLYLISHKLLGDTYDIYAAFVKHEEVHQVSSWWLAKTNYIGLTKEDYVLNLECLKTESIDDEKYGKINYEDGVVLQLSNTGCLFGYKNPGPNNLELKIKQIADEKKLKLQVGVIKDSCDSRPFTEFSLTPNICTLTIPNKYKHNGADDGIIRTEEVRKENIKICVQIIAQLTNNKQILNSSLQSTSEKLKEENAITDKNLMDHKRKLNRRLEISNLAIVKRNYFYPNNTSDFIQDFIFKIISYFRYFLD